MVHAPGCRHYLARFRRPLGRIADALAAFMGVAGPGLASPATMPAVHRLRLAGIVFPSTATTPQVSPGDRVGAGFPETNAAHRAQRLATSRGSGPWTPALWVGPTAAHRRPTRPPSGDRSYVHWGTPPWRRWDRCPVGTSLRDGQTHHQLATKTSSGTRFGLRRRIELR